MRAWQAQAEIEHLIASVPLEEFSGEDLMKCLDALRTILYLCEGDMAYENPRVLQWMINRAATRHLVGDGSEDEVEF